MCQKPLPAEGKQFSDLIEYEPTTSGSMKLSLGKIAKRSSDSGNSPIRFTSYEKDISFVEVDKEILELFLNRTPEQFLQISREKQALDNENEKQDIFIPHYPVLVNRSCLIQSIDVTDYKIEGQECKYYMLQREKLAPYLSPDRSLEFSQGKAASENHFTTQFHHSVPTNPGSSGAPILNQNGQVVGIHSRGIAISTYLIPKEGQPHLYGRVPADSFPNLGEKVTGLLAMIEMHDMQTQCLKQQTMQSRSS